MRTTRWCLASVLCAGLGADALAQVPGSERTLVTDPDVLVSMGFPRDAKNVYRAKALDRVPLETPEDWGGADFHFTPVAAKSFIGRESYPGGTVWEHSGGAGPDCCLGLVREGTEPYADAPIDLPTGVSVSAFRWWANDTNAANDIEFYAFEECLPAFAPGPRVFTVIAAGSTTGSGGYQSEALPSAVTVNNLSCSYVARVRFRAVGPSLTFQKLRVQWNRQISPAPGVATFGDVPTTHPIFQHIEALVASGITAGCGGGNYCPDNPLTRGQMAVFLSIALGLYFP